MPHACSPLPAAARRLSARVKDDSAQAQSGGAQHARGVAWGRMMEEAESEGEELRPALRWGVGGTSGSAEAMASGDG